VGADYDLLKQLYNLKKPYVLGVGDFNQHSVSKTNYTTTRPFKKQKRDISSIEYIDGFGKKIDVDITTLTKSRRVPEATSEFIREKLIINIGTRSEETVCILLLTDGSDIEKKINALDVDNIV